MRVLCVAEKNSIAKAVSAILGGGRSTSRNSTYTYVKNYDFTYNGFPFAPRGCDVTMTSVAGHLSGVDLMVNNMDGVKVILLLCLMHH